MRAKHGLTRRLALAAATGHLASMALAGTALAGTALAGTALAEDQWFKMYDSSGPAALLAFSAAALLSLIALLGRRSSRAR